MSSANKIESSLENIAKSFIKIINSRGHGLNPEELPNLRCVYLRGFCQFSLAWFCLKNNSLLEPMQNYQNHSEKALGGEVLDL